MDLTPQQKINLGLLTGAGAAAALIYQYLDSTYYVSKDIGFIIKLAKVQREANRLSSLNWTTADIWEENHKPHAKKTCFLFEDRKVTFQEVEESANRVAHWAQSIGLKAGDVVALFMDNRPEYFMTWLGLCKIGVTIALINYNVKGKPLMHSLKISLAKNVIVGAEVAEAIGAIKDDLAKEGFKIWGRGGNIPFATDLDAALPSFSTKPLPRKVRSTVKFTDTALLVYTSGTTGLPKAATIKHMRFFNMGFMFKTVFEIKSDDIIYCVLPLYHSAGGLCGLGMMIHSGATVALRSKFSATHFWDDCRKYNATVVQYIGELCRYLVALPKLPTDNQNKVRIAVGNGLRPEIWNEFQDRFNISQIGEFYGSTEGNAATVNFCVDKRSRGCVGQMGPLLYKLSKFKIVKFDVIKEEPIRDKNGWCIECDHNEPGELLGEIDDNDPVKKFDGYYGNEKATAKKVLTDAFQKGDKYFRTGDLLRRDKQGFIYFVDRIGDTFRWKGENVSTTEVAEVCGVFPGIQEVNVYGVSVPGADGRACAAAMVAAPEVNWEKFTKHCKDNLPAYAVPLFIRLLPKMEITGTFKHQKVELRNEGIDVTKHKDPMLWLDPVKKTFVPFGLPEFEQLTLGKAKL